MPDDRSELAARVRRQARGSRMLGSELYAVLLEHVAADAEAGGPAWEVLGGRHDDTTWGGSRDAIALMGAVHGRVLAGTEPALAARYPSAGGDGDAEAAWPALRDLLAREPAGLRAALDDPIQTNEVGRSAALAGGFLAVAGVTGLPLRLLELGASAGLNLRWDRYRYEAGATAWGDPASPVRFGPEWFEGADPPFGTAAEVAERRGCDAHPLDPATNAGRQTLLGWVWPDQRDRFVRLQAACDVAAELPLAVERADAVSWIAARLAEPVAGVATVVYHSIFAQYLSEDGRAELTRVIAEAGARATAEAPLAWLRMEAAGQLSDVRLARWPGGEDRLVARAGYHGRPVRWEGS